jgi:hypothetical protein
MRPKLLILLIFLFLNYTPGFGIPEGKIPAPAGKVSIKKVKEEPKQQKEALIYPNPFKQVIYIDNNSRVYKEAALTDVLGKVVARLSLNDRLTKIDSHIADLSALPDGIYFLSLTGPGEENFTTRLIKSGK